MSETLINGIKAPANLFISFEIARFCNKERKRENKKKEIKNKRFLITVSNKQASFRTLAKEREKKKRKKEKENKGAVDVITKLCVQH